jgi:Ni/Fe-hydrogenase subunit HybB-like protein
LLGLFTAGVLYFVIVFHLSKLYGTQNHGFERFILLDGGIYTRLFWIVQIALGSLLPLALVYAPRLQSSGTSLVAASLLIILGAFAQLYVIIIGGQAYPLNIFPGYIVESSFFDGVIGEYTPSLWEFLLGFGGVTSALLIALLGIRVLPIMPESLAPEAK